MSYSIPFASLESPTTIVGFPVRLWRTARKCSQPHYLAIALVLLDWTQSSCSRRLIDQSIRFLQLAATSTVASAPLVCQGCCNRLLLSLLLAIFAPRATLVARDFRLRFSLVCLQFERSCLRDLRWMDILRSANRDAWLVSC